MNAHTKGPWLVDENNIHIGSIATLNGDDAGYSEIWSEWDGSQKSHKANARRIVACVNSCEGIQTEILEHFGQMVVDGALSNRQLSMQHDKLLDVARMLVDWSARYPLGGTYSKQAGQRIIAEIQAINAEAVSALAKIEPKQQQKETQHA